MFTMYFTERPYQDPKSGYFGATGKPIMDLSLSNALYGEKIGADLYYRYVNPFSRPYQKPHPPIWIPGVVSRDTVIWAAQHRYPYVMLATQLEPTRQAFEVYDETARAMGYEAGPQHRAYNFKVHVDE